MDQTGRNTRGTCHRDLGSRISLRSQASDHHDIQPNETKLADVRVVTKSVTFYRLSLNAHDRWSREFHPETETDATVTFMDAEGRKCERHLDVYVEQSTHGSINAQVRSCQDIIFETSLYEL